MERKYYIDTEKNDDEAYRFAINFACNIVKEDNKVKQIVLYVQSKKTTGWFDRLFGSETVKALFTGVRIMDCPVKLKIETKQTYKKEMYGEPTDLVICCGMDSKDIFKLDDYSSIKYIIAIPWLKKLTEKWVTTWNAKEITGKDERESSYPEPTNIVKIAMQELTDTINSSTGILHPNDNNRAKTYIRALYKYEDSLDSDVVGAYLIKQLNWDTQHAMDIEKLISTLNKGSYFKGGEKKGLQNYYKKWKTKTE